MSPGSKYSCGNIPKDDDVIIQIEPSDIEKYTYQFGVELKVVKFWNGPELNGLEIEGYPDAVGAFPQRFKLLRRSFRDNLDKILEE